MKVSLVFCMVVLFAHVGLPCGINWSEPHAKIEGCNEQGYVLVAEKLAELNIPDEKEPVPIWATFDSSRLTASPYAGMGWKIPFLESSMVQLSEDEFQFLAPGGWRQLFRRNGKDSEVLVSGGGWKGQLSQDHATLWADCGWRIDLHKGKIVQLKTPHGQTLSYNYTNGRIATVTCGMKALAVVDPAEGPDNTLGITIDGKRYSLAKADQPRVQRVAGVNVIGGNDPSFSRLNGPESQTRTFAYGVDDQTRPVLTITNAAKQDTAVSWDPETRRITRYGVWKYDIKPGENSLANAAIGRTNSKGQTEFWHRDGANGKEIIRQINGVTSITSRFTSGKLAGKIRKIETEQNGKTLLVRKNDYGEDGKLLRVVGPEGVIETFTYSSEGKVISSRHPIPTSKQLHEQESTMLQAIKVSEDKTEKQNLFYQLGLLYAGDSQLPDKAREIAQLITNRQMQFNIMLQSYDYNSKLTNKDKITAFQQLLQEYPEQTNILNEIINNRKKEL